MSLAVSMLGTGIVAFPYAFNLCGYVAGPAALFAFGVMAVISYSSLIKCTAKMRESSYGALLQNIPKGWSHYTNAALWLLLILATTAYVLISAHIIRSVVSAALHVTGQAPVFLQNPCLFALILVVIFPLCLLKSFQGLSAVTTYCSVAIITVVVLIIYKAFEIYRSSPPPSQQVATAGTDPKSVVLALPILGCAMFGHMNISQIYAELQPSIKPRAHLMALTACVGAIVLYTAVGAAGYAAFGQAAKDDILDQIASQSGVSGVVLITQGLLASFVTLKAPLIILPLRSLTLSLIAPTVSLDDLSRQGYVGLTGILLVFVYIAAIALPELGLLLQILGATCVVPLCFVVPARIAWTLEQPRPVKSCVILAVVGTLTSVLSLIAVFA